MRARITKNKFTIIELVVVILVLGLMASVAAVRLDHFIPSLRIDSASRNLAGLINYLYNESVSSGKVYGLRYNTTDQYYEVRLLWAEVNEDQQELPEEAQSLTKRVYLPEGVKFKRIEDDFGQSVPEKNDRMEVRFDPSGFITPHRIYLEDSSEKVMTLEVLFLTGQVIFHDGEYTPQTTLDAVVPK